MFFLPQKPVKITGPNAVSVFWRQRSTFVSALTCRTNEFPLHYPCFPVPGVFPNTVVCDMRVWGP